MDTIEKRLQAVKSRIARACAAAGRDPRDIVLVAVSKTFPADAVRAAHAAGQRDFGENHAQDAVAKIDALGDLDLVWHFIGPVQSNKTRSIAAHVAWVHSIDRLKIAERLAAQRPEALPPLQVCIQVNVSGEATKSGVAPAEAPALARAVAALPRLRLRGLMAIPEPTDDPALQRRRFESLRDLRDRLAADGLALDTLSMGMSDDLEAAIAAGATMVRVGTAIFGARSGSALSAIIGR
ncbi:MAG TPA: YggS family pyridoxal phosphate-dependent enzyme [Burkholderiales bacterium]|nr:YggS family pyridoxal phosphate-dependent enzyme [Burkholderiales bacterium]